MQNLIYSHLTKYPGMQPEDCIKLLYQQAMGPGHLFEDPGAYSEALRQELAIPGLITAQPHQPEPIGDTYARVYLSGFDKGPDLATFTRLCGMSANREGDPACLRRDAQTLRSMAQGGLLPYAAGEVERAVDVWLQNGCPQPRHSGRYRALYQPHYRVLRRDIAHYLPVFTAIDRAAALKPHVLVGIDGMSAAGKSALAALLEQVFGCGVVHCDDFFLQPHQRTPARLAAAGGNIDYERLAPVAARAGDDRGFSYQAYNCATGRLEAWQQVPQSSITLLEGVYALHPGVAAPCDVKVFLSVDARVQKARLEARSPALFRRFADEWLPMENRYFSEMAIREGCDVVVDTTDL